MRLSCEQRAWTLLMEDIRFHCARSYGEMLEHELHEFMVGRDSRVGSISAHAKGL